MTTTIMAMATTSSISVKPPRLTLVGRNCSGHNIGALLGTNHPQHGHANTVRLNVVVCSRARQSTDLGQYAIAPVRRARSLARGVNGVMRIDKGSCQDTGTPHGRLPLADDEVVIVAPCRKRENGGRGRRGGGDTVERKSYDVGV